jgi:hypothetical protein
MAPDTTQLREEILDVLRRHRRGITVQRLQRLLAHRDVRGDRSMFVVDVFGAVHGLSLALGEAILHLVAAGQARFVPGPRRPRLAPVR